MWIYCSNSRPGFNGHESSYHSGSGRQPPGCPGVCREVESTLFRRRPKAVVMECGDRQVKVYLHARVRNLAVGERLRIYVAESAPVYEEDDILVLSGYLAVEVGKK